MVPLGSRLYTFIMSKWISGKSWTYDQIHLYQGLFTPYPGTSSVLRKPSGLQAVLKVHICCQYICGLRWSIMISRYFWNKKKVLWLQKDIAAIAHATQRWKEQKVTTDRWHAEKETRSFFSLTALSPHTWHQNRRVEMRVLRCDF